MLVTRSAKHLRECSLLPEKAWLGGQGSNLDRRLQRPLSYQLDDPRAELGNLILEKVLGSRRGARYPWRRSCSFSPSTEPGPEPEGQPGLSCIVTLHNTLLNM